MRVDRFKRYYVMPFLGVNMVAAAEVVYQLAAGGAPEVLVPALVVHLTPLLLAGYLMVGQREGTTSSQLWLAQAATYLGTLALAVQLPDTAGRFALAVVSCGLLVIYIYWYSRFGRGPAAIRVGATMPDVPLIEDGRQISTAVFRGHPVAYYFIRGNWCPLCMAQARSIAKRYTELEAMGAEVVLVSPQSEDQTRQLAEKFGVRFRYLRDPGLRAARMLGLDHQGGVPIGMRGYDPDTVFPTVVVTDADGRVVFLDQTDNYRVRPTPDTIIEALTTAQESSLP